MKMFVACMLPAALAVVSLAAPDAARAGEGAYRARAVGSMQVRGAPAAFYGQTVRLSFIDQARTSGRLPYRVCVIETRRKVLSPHPASHAELRPGHAYGELTSPQVES